MKFKEIIADLPEDKKILLKKYRNKVTIACLVLFGLYFSAGAIAAYLQWGLPEASINIDTTGYTCNNLQGGIKEIGKVMSDTGKLPPLNLLQSIENLEVKLKC